MLNRRELITTA